MYLCIKRHCLCNMNMNESCHTYQWVMSHIWMSHVTHIYVFMHQTSLPVPPSHNRVRSSAMKPGEKKCDNVISRGQFLILFPKVKERQRCNCEKASSSQVIRCATWSFGQRRAKQATVRQSILFPQQWDNWFSRSVSLLKKKFISAFSPPLIFLLLSRAQKTSSSETLLERRSVAQQWRNSWKSTF